MIKISEKLKNHRFIIGIVLIIFILLIVLIFFISKTMSNAVANVDTQKLKKYENTYIGDNSGVCNILGLLPYSKHMSGIELQTKNEPYELTVNYNMNGNKQKLEYNSLKLFALIQNLGVINYNLLDNTFTVTREECIKIADLSLDGIDSYINKEKIWGDNQAYKIAINKNGMKVFENPALALKQLEIDYADGINAIKKQIGLLSPNIFNYEKYKIYGWQIVTDDKNISRQGTLISAFFDIYENSFNNEEYYPIPTTN